MPSTSSQLYDEGYAILTFNINSDVQNWRYRDETFKTFSVPSKNLELPRITIALIDDVRKAAIK